MVIDDISSVSVQYSYKVLMFTVHPKQGVINPDEKCVVIVSYKHDVVGTHRIPVLFKIDKGKEVLVSQKTVN